LSAIIRFGAEPALFQQANNQALGSLGIATALHDFVEHVAILIDGTPEPVFPAGDGDGDLVQMPNVA
jgi:hypothetical protein